MVKKIAYLGKESPDIYKKFMTPETAARGRAYMETHRAALSRAEAKYGVAPEVIVGILTVESGLGSNTGKYPVFNVFASLAVMDTPEVIQEVGLTASRDRLKKKAAWARRELTVFLEYCASHRLDPFSLSGSWAGAMGYCQFLPSSLQSCGVAANGKGPVDLFTHDDAIFSIACYLQKSGFNAKTGPPGAGPSIATITPTPTWTRCSPWPAGIEAIKPSGLSGQLFKIKQLVILTE